MLRCMSLFQYLCLFGTGIRHFARLLTLTFSHSNSSLSFEYLLLISVSLCDSATLISGSLSVYGCLKLLLPSNFSCILIIWLYFRFNYGVLAFAPSLVTCLHQSDECGTTFSIVSVLKGWAIIL